ncbi:MAG: UTP--glucose-1-phosphate uridylyltransferase [Parachlamydiales bacterium]|nr:UTP--glucose-1-phosphate uridylyltransferase [Parachlamydiales bacterium]
MLKKYPWIDSEQQSVIEQMTKIGQAERVFHGSENEKAFRELLDKLVLIDRFYREIGGIAGYQKKILDLMNGAKEERFCDALFHSPDFLDISKETKEVEEAVEWGLEAMPQMAEIYPLGGAADRLHLVEESTGKELPAAKLPFAGRPLLEHLVRDLQARERLYEKTFGKKIVTPIAIMTSHEKNNHAHVTEICEEFHYFGRPKDSIRFFTQPLVPTVNSKGDWCMAGPLKPVLKPGGHGAIWKLARDVGILDWFQSLGKKKCLVRQINNPIAGLDYGLLAFTGIGWKKEMVFGFASAPRLLKAAEGVNILVEKDSDIVLSNIEYCDFDKFGIQDSPLKEGEPYSRFSSNTNILFADLDAISNAVQACPFPGLLINMKKGTYTCESGEKKEEEMARLESTMQNIADVFVEKKSAQLKTEKTFVTYNVRHKTISTAKKAFVPGKAIQETPENCFYDLLFAHRELLTQCGTKLPEKRKIEEYLEKGPEFLFLYHPALGPLYSIIRKKLKGGQLHLGSELILEAANASIENLNLQGSLQIFAEEPCLSEISLRNVSVENRGVNWNASAPFWKAANQHHETVKVILKGQSRFIAQNTHLKGNRIFIVEDGKTLEI